MGGDEPGETRGSLKQSHRTAIILFSDFVRLSGVFAAEGARATGSLAKHRNLQLILGLAALSVRAADHREHGHRLQGTARNENALCI